MKQIALIVSILVACMILSCSTIPEGLTPVQPFDKSRYLGKWYEIARLDFKFERNLINTTADYSLNKNGTIKVVNRGYDTTTNKWKTATGKAKFVKDENVAKLKVSFFGPFYSGYNVVALDNEYKYALVAGEDLKYLWILSRNTTLPEDVKKNYLELAESVGYKINELIWVRHSGR